MVKILVRVEYRTHCIVQENKTMASHAWVAAAFAHVLEKLKMLIL